MALKALVRAYAWARYSKKLAARIDKPRWTGWFTQADVAGRGVKLATGFEGDIDAGNAVALYWLVDENGGVILDAKFQAFGQSALIGAADIACELVMGKNYAQAQRMGADFLDRHVRDSSDVPAFPDETSAHLNLVIGAIENAAAQCTGIALPEVYTTPAPLDVGEVREGGYPGFSDMSKESKLALIEQLVAEEIRPYIELDAGGIEIVDLLNDRELIIAYSGACTTCFSATGMTLSYIQQMVRAKIHPDLVVVPDLEALAAPPAG